MPINAVALEGMSQPLPQQISLPGSHHDDKIGGAGSQVFLLGIGTATPLFSANCSAASEFMLKVAEAHGQPSAVLGLIERIHQRSGIERRHSVLRDFIAKDARDFEFFPKAWSLAPSPGTAARMKVFERYSVSLALAACRQALVESEVNAEQITHLVISTCTGFFAPGLDVLLGQQLGLNPDVKRTVLGFMGCNAGVSGMRTCREIALGQPDAMILQVCVELCTIHYQSDFNPETIVSNAIFADGAAAAVYAGRVPGRPPTSEIPGRCVELIATTSHVAADTLDRMSWRIGDTGFLMHLDAQIPAIMANAAREFVSNLARAGNAGLDDISKWAIHPGGRKIVEAVGEALGLGPTELQSSYSVLRNYGNMSSATILFVLERELARRQKTSELLACVAFGPGLTIEGALFHVR